MVKLDFIIVCDEAYFLERDKKLNIFGVFDTINVSTLPIIVSKMSVVIKLYMDRGSYTETLRIKKSDIEIIKFDTSVDKKESGPHQFVHNLLNIRFSEEGEHIIEVLIDNNPIGSAIINVKKIG